VGGGGRGGVYAPWGSGLPAMTNLGMALT